MLKSLIIHRAVLTCSLTLNNDFTLWSIESDFFFMSDESNFYLDGHVNRHNFVYWNDHCPENHFTESSLNIQKVGVWAALSATQLFGPYFYSDTINQSKYREILTKFVNDLENVFGFEICNSVWFQQDGASSHTAGDTIRYVTSLFGNRTIGKKSYDRTQRC